MAANEPDCFSVLRCSLTPDENTRRRLDVAFVAAGHLERALTRWALSNLQSMRRTTRWRDACAMPTGLSATGEVNDAVARSSRNAALNALRKEFCLSEYGFTKKVLALRGDSRWIGDHVPSSSALVHATQVWQAFAAHFFRSAGQPKVPRPWDNRVLHGYVRDAGRGAATDEEIEKATAKVRKPPKARRWVVRPLLTDSRRWSCCDSPPPVAQSCTPLGNPGRDPGKIHPARGMVPGRSRFLATGKNRAARGPEPLRL